MCSVGIYLLFTSEVTGALQLVLDPCFLADQLPGGARSAPQGHIKTKNHPPKSEFKLILSLLGPEVGRPEA